ncbi:glycerol uptake facilitator protein [Williamsoniiplasma luminosum]|uniref:Glycerol uptake facilitator protein n=1 Tax=Williamsoniiplasma luminosum TaxID=214888 RepID=A0A2K8NW90_9MOLU|nr:MIP/aquaporin family protein [Williamsoniiplasma luminosum]ATZ16903.1 glycerol uptake facilitator protein [Williamsoniiplasma luminosum]
MENAGMHFFTEFLGSLILIILGNGVVANVVLKNTKGYKSPFLMIALGWGFAVAVGATVAAALGGKAHLNPAVTIAMVVNGWESGVGSWGLFPIFIIAQFLGFFVGQIIVDLFYFDHIKKHFKKDSEDFGTKSVLAMHSTGPQTRTLWVNFFSEFIGTALLVTFILAIGKIGTLPTYLGPIFVGMVIMAIGCSLSGTTGYAINPFRDLTPRIVYQLLTFLPFANREESADWQYSWIPVVAPMSAGILVGALFLI